MVTGGGWGGKRVGVGVGARNMWACGGIVFSGGEGVVGGWVVVGFVVVVGAGKPDMRK